MQRQEEIQKELEAVGDDLDRMSVLLDELQDLTSSAVDLDVSLIDKKIDQVCRLLRGLAGLGQPCAGNGCAELGWLLAGLHFSSSGLPCAAACNNFVFQRHSHA
jgi:hypothetical protein